MEAPPRALGRALALLIALFFAVAVGWAALSPVDIVAVTEGRVVPAGQIKILQPFQSGVVRAINVEEGDHVDAGQLLIQLDASEPRADRQRVEAQLAQAEMDRAIAVALLESEPLLSFIAPSAATSEAVELGLSLITGRWQNHISALAGNSAEADRLRAAIAAFGEQRLTYEQSLGEIEALLSSTAELETQGLVTKSQTTNLRLQRINARSQVQAVDQQLIQAELSLNQNQAGKEQLQAAFVSEVRQQLSEAMQSILMLNTETMRLADREQLYRLTAPVSGYVNELAIHTIGAVLSPSERVLTIIPDDVGMEIEASLLNKDFGFVSAGQHAEVKLEPFPFTRYGTVSATVSNVSADAIDDPQLGPIYTIRVSPDAALPQGSNIRIAPGMRATVEIHTGQRTVLEFFLAPLLQYRDEAIRER